MRGLRMHALTGAVLPAGAMDASMLHTDAMSACDSLHAYAPRVASAARIMLAAARCVGNARRGDRKARRAGVSHACGRDRLLRLSSEPVTRDQKV
jgi:hypothetical protein